MSPNVLGLDLSLSQSGAAQVHQSGLVQTWRHPTDPLPTGATLEAEAARLVEITAWAVGRGTTATVLAVLEAPSLGSTTGKQHERAALWWMVVRALSRLGVPVASVAPSSLKQKIAGHGHADKAAMGRAVRALYPSHGLDRVSNDEIDAVALATVGVIKLAQHLGPEGGWSGPWLEARALNVESGCRWPDLGPGWVKPAPAPLRPVFAVPS